jgi:hypothetical protein
MSTAGEGSKIHTKKRTLILIFPASFDWCFLHSAFSMNLSPFLLHLQGLDKGHQKADGQRQGLARTVMKNQT